MYVYRPFGPTYVGTIELFQNSASHQASALGNQSRATGYGRSATVRPSAAPSIQFRTRSWPVTGNAAAVGSSRRSNA